MAIIKGKSDGGSGGKRGHSNMNHWMHTDEIKSAARKTRRLEAQSEITAEVADHIKGRELFHCAKCGVSWEMTSGLSAAVKQEVEALVRGDRRMEAISRLHAEGVDICTSKATIYHIPHAPGVCHGCYAQLANEGQSCECPQCRALNICWC
jgi:hypothetical protein